jgi:hypothetical protein
MLNAGEIGVNHIAHPEAMERARRRWVRQLCSITTALDDAPDDQHAFLIERIA